MAAKALEALPLLLTAERAEAVAVAEAMACELPELLATAKELDTAEPAIHSKQADLVVIMLARRQSGCGSRTSAADSKAACRVHMTSWSLLHKSPCDMRWQRAVCCQHACTVRLVTDADSAEKCCMSVLEALTCSSDFVNHVIGDS